MIRIIAVLLISLFIFAIAAGFFAARAHAEEQHPRMVVMEDTAGNVVKLFDDLCINEPAQTTEWLSKWLATLHRAIMFYEGKEYLACWFSIDQMVMVIDSAGDVSPISKRAFHPAETNSQ